MNLVSSNERYLQGQKRLIDSFIAIHNDIKPCDFGLNNDIEHNKDDKGNYLDCKRPPFHVCAWHKKNKEFRFPSVNYGEDWGWVEQFIKYAKTEVHIDKVLHKYNFDPIVTEASTEDNEIWTNPNKKAIDKIDEEESDSESC